MRNIYHTQIAYKRKGFEFELLIQMIIFSLVQKRYHFNSKEILVKYNLSILKYQI